VRLVGNGVVTSDVQAEDRMAARRALVALSGSNSSVASSLVQQCRHLLVWGHHHRPQVGHIRAAWREERVV